MADIDPNESDPIILWTEIARLHAGREELETWRTRAVQERVRARHAEDLLRVMTYWLSGTQDFPDEAASIRTRSKWLDDNLRYLPDTREMIRKIVNKEV